MHKTLSFSLCVIAVFSMFFGAGNFLFPLILGSQQTYGYWGIGAFGFCATGILIPVLGFLGVVLCNGSAKAFFLDPIFSPKMPALSVLHKCFAIFFIVLSLSIMLLLIGVPREAIILSGSIQQIYPYCTTVVIHVVFYVLLFLCIYKDHRGLKILVEILSPLKIIVFIIFSICVCWKAYHIGIDTEHTSKNKMQILADALTGGYLTLDLVAAPFYAFSILQYFKKYQKQQNTNTQAYIVVCGLGIACLNYTGLVYSACKLASVLQRASSATDIGLLSKICLLVFGNSAQWMFISILCVVIFTTSLAIANAVLSFLLEHVWWVRKYKILSIMVLLGISFVVSLVDFASLRDFAVTNLLFSYPVLIILAVYRIGKNI
jgi:branched-chain amino acid:cation transporter, LIVCS family